MTTIIIANLVRLNAIRTCEARGYCRIRAWTGTSARCADCGSKGGHDWAREHVAREQAVRRG
jgi:hypothetical protein